MPWGRILEDQPTESFTTHRSGTTSDLSPDGSLGDWLDRANRKILKGVCVGSLWAAWISTPAPWDSSQNVRKRPSLSVWPGQWIMNVRRRPSISSRICCPGYTIGYMVSGVGFPALFKSLALMESKSRLVSKGQITEMVMAASHLRARL